MALPGFRDFYPDDCAFRNAIFARWRDVSRRYGFVEYDGPPLEPLDLFTKKSGDEIVTQLYHFKDKGDREVALRPEMTPTLARLVTARHKDFKKPLKWFSIPQVYRYERPQKGRGREHYQLNCDIIGEAGLFDAHGRRLAWTPLAAISPALQRAVIATEDRRFFGHHGAIAGSFGVTRGYSRSCQGGAVAYGALHLQLRLGKIHAGNLASLVFCHTAVHFLFPCQRFVNLLCGLSQCSCPFLGGHRGIARQLPP